MGQQKQQLLLKKNFYCSLICISALFAIFTVAQDDETRPYLQVLPDGNLVIAAAQDRNLSLQTPGAGVVTINGVNLASFFDNSLATACSNSSFCGNGGTCVPSKAGAVCVCPPNWKGPTCRDDVNECQQSLFATCLNGGTCRNSRGNFSCQCIPEFSGRFCESPYNDCTATTCGNGACVDIARSVRGVPAYRCICNPGWRQSQTRGQFGPCNVDVNECTEGLHACSRQPRVPCINTPGSYSCGPCPAGYTAMGRDCIDVDECRSAQPPCSRNPRVSCTNVPGSYICGNCPPGYEGDGRSCLAIDRCRPGSSLCHPLATCVNIQNSILPQCNCPPGYLGDGYGPSGCFPGSSGGAASSSMCSNTTCFNGGSCLAPPGATYFTCLCRQGFSGRRCEININDCESVRCANGGTCLDGVNSFRCLCRPKFTGRLCETEVEGCGGFLTASNGTLKYPSFQTSYNHSMDCEWRIMVFSNNAVLNVQFTRMSLEPDPPNCHYDFVEVRDGPTSAYPLLFPRLCGQAVPAAKNSSRNAVIVRFHSDASLAFEGFELRWTAIEPRCGNYLTAPFGTITSPGFPGPYPPRRRCVWRIGLVPGSTIQFNFVSMDIESSQNCSSDSLKIYDGFPPMVNILLGTFCGRAASLTPVRTVGPMATVAFTTDLIDSGNTGFSLQYSSTRSCGEDFSSPSGVIVYPRQQRGQYSPRSLCYWSVVLPADRQISYVFEQLDVEFTQGCSGDYVELRSGFDPDTSQQLGVHCGRPANASTISGQTPGNVLLVKFRSDANSVTGAGFRLRYSTACGGVFSDYIGSFTSPNYPNNYQNNSVCSYLVSTGPSLRIVLRFGSLDLQPQDCIDIFDGSSAAESPLLRRTCGRYLPFEVNSTASVLVVRFTAVVGGRRGFRASYQSIGFDCGGVLTAQAGVVSSPGFPGRYPHGVSCYWAISAPPGNVVRFTFTSFALETSPICQYDFVLLYEDATPDFNGTLGRFCGNAIPPVLTSFSNLVHIKFSSDASVNDIGFSVSYVVLPAHSACGGEIRQSYGVIRSPNYPNRYPNGVSCEWVIIGRPGSQVKINITDFDLELPGQTGNCYDFLEIRQGQFASSPLAAKMCGPTPRQRVIYGLSSRMWIRFSTDASLTGRGFRLLFDSLATGCGGTLSAPSGTILSPNFPMAYDHLADCYWTIYVASGSRIQLSIPVMDLEDHAYCNYDYVELRDGGSLGDSMGRYCNQTNLPAQLTTTTNRLWVRFRSDSSLSGTGFMINYRTMCKNISLNALHGTIQSPGYPDNNYPGLLNCSWVINAPTGNRINLTFAAFDVQRTTNCAVDYLAVYDIGGDAVSPLGKFCGFTLPALLTSRTNKVLVRFVTDNVISGEGFSLDYRVYGCGDIFMHASGFIFYQAPTSVADGTDPNVECQWSIRAPVGRRIRLMISQMSIGELSDGNCEQASLQIFNAPTAEGHPASTLCGSLADSRNFTSTGNFMTLHLTPLETFPNERSSLVASYSFIEGGCGGSFSVPSGIISSPLQSGSPYYPSNVFCQWFIHAQPLHAVNLTFLTFELEDSLSISCRFDHVSVYDGFDSSNNRTRLLRHCGPTMPSRRTLISSHGNDMLVEMRADGSVQARGFTAAFSESCGATVNLTRDRPSADFSSPNHPRPYYLGSNCTWIFRALNGGRIMLDFTRFDLPNATSSAVGCSTYLRVFDGDRPDSIELVTRPVCGTIVPPAVFTRSSMLVVRFISSNSQIPRTGFLATATLLDRTSSCGRVVEADHGVLTSPYYPDPYPPNFECIWTLRASPGNKMRVQFFFFDLQTSDSCSRDFVELREDGPGGRLLTSRLCGRSQPPSGILPANPIWLKFSSDATVESRGFLMRYYTVYGGDYFSDSGQISSPHYPRPYGPNMDVRWTITVGQNYIIQLSFLDFDLDNFNSLQAGTCQSDFLEIRDGASRNSPLIGSRRCGRRAVPLTTYSTGNRLHIYFHSDSSIEAPGFLANWTAVPWRPPPSGSDLSPCYFKFNVTSFAITSISPAANFNSSYCVWRVRSSPSGHIVFNVTRLNIPSNSRNCRDSYVAFYENIYERTIETRRLCGYLAPTAPISSITNEVYIIYIATQQFQPLNNRQVGFTLNATEQCGTMTTLAGGNITSPRYPLPYPPNANCVWTILARPGRTISLRFAGQFEISDTPPTCRNNYLEVITTNRTRFCGSRAPRSTLATTSNYATLVFATNGTISQSAPGFSLTYEEVPYPCGDSFWLTVDRPSLTITSPNYPQSYMPHLDCRWLITAPVGKSIRINVEALDMEAGYGTRCPYDFVALHDGATPSAPVISSLCGTGNFSTLRTSDNTLLIRFVTDNSLERPGFLLKLDIAICGGTIFGTSGSLFSPHYPAAYPPNADCQWTLHAPTGHYLAIKFTTFELASPRSHMSCQDGDDGVRIYDGRSTSDPVVNYLCGNFRLGLPYTVNTSDSWALIRFQSNNDQASGSGFAAQFVASIEECGGDINATQGTIQSPNWPGLYPHLRKCRWNIRVGEGRRIRLQFTNFSLEASTGCAWDYVALYNGIHDKAPLIGRYCGSVAPDIVRSSMNTMTVIFRTDGSLSSGGFRAVFTSTEEAACGGTIRLSTSPPNAAVNLGSLTSPNYGTNASHGNNAWCVWKFILPAGSSGSLLLSFVDLRLEHHGNCDYDAVDIHEGNSIESDTLPMGTFCSNQTSPGRQPIDVPTAIGPTAVWVVFSTDYSVEGVGFNLTYQFFNCGGRSSLAPNSWLTLRNPNYPRTDNTRQVCTWLGEGSPNSRAQFRVDELSISCAVGNVTIFNGPSLTSPAVTKLCNSGLSVNRVVPLETRQVRVVYQLRPRGSTTASGRFRLSLQAPVGGCGGVIHSTSGNISTPNYPSRYPSGTTCTWLLSVSVGYHYLFSFGVPFDIPQSTACSDNFVKVIEFPSSAAFDQLIPLAIQRPSIMPSQRLLLPTICGSASPPQPFNSTRNGVAVSFSGLLPAAGFVLSWTVGCGETFIDASGIISSPNFPNNYGNNLICDYIINPRTRLTNQNVGRFIIFEFLAFSVEGGTQCPYDSVTVFTQNGTAPPRVYARMCGSSLPGALSVASSNATVRFVTDGATNDTGFQIRYRTTECGGLLSAANGMFGTPTTPLDYPHGANCSWKITAPPGRIIVVAFSQFGLEASGNCAYDFVEFYDGPDDSNPNKRLGRFCGNQMPSPIRSTGNVLLVRFASDHSISGIGFRAVYYQSYACGGLVNVSATGNGGTISSLDADGDGLYESNLDCVWLLRLQPATANRVISLTFNSFELQPPMSGDCRFGDYVQVADGAFAAPSTSIRYCGNSLRQRTLTSTGPSIAVLFHSNGAANFRGFTASYAAVAPLCGGRFNASTVPAQLTWTPPTSQSSQNLVQCLWQISGLTVNDRINVTVTQLNVLLSPQCRQSYLELKDKEPRNGVNQPVHYCGPNVALPVIFESTTDIVSVSYVGVLPTAANPAPVFNLVYQLSSCNKTYTTASGRVTSPNFPASYPTNVDCQVVIRAPIGTYLALYFRLLDIEAHSTCDFDFLQIHSGASTSSPLVGRFCNNASLPNPIFLQSNVALLHLHTDSSVGGGGYDITYSASRQIPGCGGNFTHINGTFTSPQYPLVYPANLVCTWRIQLPSRYQLRFAFPRFSLLPNSTCATDSVQVYGGYVQTDATLRATYCATSSVSPFYLLSNSAIVVFRSGSLAANADRTTLAGFRLVYYGILAA